MNNYPEAPCGNPPRADQVFAEPCDLSSEAIRAKEEAGFLAKKGEFFEQMKNPPPAFRPVAFWFLNHRLEADELRRQVHEMADKGLGGFMAHARDGLRTGYLKEDWGEAMRTAIEAAEQRGLQVWLYDENHYPSGPAGDNLAFRFPDRTMQSLAVRHEEILAPGAEWILPKLPGQGLNMVLAASLEQPRAQDLSELADKGRTSWRFELTPWAGQTGKLEIYAANTPHNLFMESPRPAGLIGPVSLKLTKPN